MSRKAIPAPLTNPKGMPDPCLQSTRLAPGTVGAMHELAVATDLLRRGFYVFRSMSPSCPCDLIAFHDGCPPLRVEVRTSYRVNDGSISRRPLAYLPDRYDIGAIVTHDGGIEYVPPLPSLDVSFAAD